MKNFLKITVLISLVSCGNTPHWKDLLGESKSEKSQPEEIVEAVLPELLDKEGCDILYPQGVGEVVAAVSCENESYILYEDGSFVEGDIADLDLGELPVLDDTIDTPVTEDNIVACSDEELIVNGSFEEGHDLGENQWGLYETLPGWYSNIIKRNAAIEVQNGSSIGGISASDGTAKVELDAHNKDGFKRSDAILVQDILTGKSDYFVLSFYYSARVAGNDKTNRAKVIWNGKKVARLNNNTVGWKSYSIVVKSISEFQRLEFVGVHDQDTVGGFIDNVSVKKICVE
jgi:hypothetical protein